jgi:hypothetical protein
VWCSSNGAWPHSTAPPFGDSARLREKRFADIGLVGHAGDDVQFLEGKESDVIASDDWSARRNVKGLNHSVNSSLIAAGCNCPSNAHAS